MHKSRSLFTLTTALHVSGVTITHLQEDKTTVTTASGNRYTILLSAAIVEVLGLISPNSSTIARFNLTTAIHVSGVTITHLQEHKTTVTTASGNRYTVLLSAAILEELGLIIPNSSTIAADKSTV